MNSAILKVRPIDGESSNEYLYEQLGNQAEAIFKIITSGNGSDFAGIYQLLTGITDVFFARPYVFYERKSAYTN